MIWKFTFVFMVLLSSIFLQWCRSDQVMDYIFDDDSDFGFPDSPKVTETAAPVTVEPTKEPVKEPSKEPIKAPVEESSKKGVKVDLPVEEPVKKPLTKPVEAFTKQSAKAPSREPVKLPLEDFLKVPAKENGKNTSDFVAVQTKESGCPRCRSNPVVKQVNKLGNKGAPQAINALSFLTATLSSGVKGLKTVVEESTDFSTKAIENVNNARNSTFDSMQGVVNSTAQKTINRFNSWSNTLDLLRKSMSGSVKKNIDKGHSITITTSSDAPVKTLSAFAEKWAGGGGLGGGSGNKGGGRGGGASSALGFMPPALPEVTSVDFSNFWK